MPAFNRILHACRLPNERIPILQTGFLAVFASRVGSRLPKPGLITLPCKSQLPTWTHYARRCSGLIGLVETYGVDLADKVMTSSTWDWE